MFYHLTLRNVDDDTDERILPSFNSLKLQLREMTNEFYSNFRYSFICKTILYLHADIHTYIICMNLQCTYKIILQIDGH